MNIEEVYEYITTFDNVYEDIPFGSEYLVFKIRGKMIALLFLETYPIKMNVKCNSEVAMEVREMYPNAVFPGYHMNKKYWNTILIDELPADVVKKMILHSYEEVILTFPKKVKQEMNYNFIYPFSKK